MVVIKNAYNGRIYHGIEKGSTQERQFYTVMPVDGKEKLYFESESEYKMWFHKQFQYHPERKVLGIESLTYTSKNNRKT